MTQSVAVVSPRYAAFLNPEATFLVQYRIGNYLQQNLTICRSQRGSFSRLGHEKAFDRRDIAYELARHFHINWVTRTSFVSLFWRFDASAGKEFRASGPG